MNKILKRLKFVLFFIEDKDTEYLETDDNTSTLKRSLKVVFR